MTNKIKTLGAVLALGAGLAIAENDASRVASVEMTTYRGNPAVKVTANLSDPSVSSNRYVFQYTTNLTSGSWTTDTKTITSNSLDRTFVHQPTIGFYRLKRVN